MRKILIVAYHYPPDGVVGAVRIAKFSKYLSRLNWEVKVITVSDKYRKYFNYELHKEVENLNTIKTYRLKKFIPFINEEGFYWLPILIKKLFQIIPTFKPDIVFFTGGPFYHWTSAILIKKLFKIPYVLDFRDPWSLNPYRKNKNKFASFFAKTIESVLEPPIIKKADLIINVTDEASEMYKRKYKNLKKEKFITIYNGFDLEDLNKIGKGINFSNFDITYTGKFGNFRNPEPFFKAFNQLINDLSLSPEDIRFVWVGAQEEIVLKIIKKYELIKFCNFVGYKPYIETLKYIKGSKVNLILAGEHIYEPTTKIFDYIFLNKFILAIAPESGFIDKTLKDYVYSNIVYDNNSEKIFEILKYQYSNVDKIQKGNVFYYDLKKFDREQNTILLNQYLCNLIEKIYE